MPKKYFDLDVDGTLTSNSDNYIPSQKAVKTYVDNKDSGSVHTTGNETVAGTKTFSSTIDGTCARANADESGNNIEQTYATKAELENIEYVLQIIEW